MAQFRIDDTSGNSVVVDLATNNSWSTISGDPTFIGVEHGHWNAVALAKRVFISDESDKQLGFLNMNLPFANLNVGDSGDGLFGGGGPGITWTLVSK